MMKKQSLFKQKLKQSKVDKQTKPEQKSKEPQVQTFPKVFKIQSFQIKDESKNKEFVDNIKPNEIVEENIKKEENDPIDDQPYLQRHRKQLESVMSEQQLNQINQQNWKVVDTMDEQQRNNYINLIQNTLPKHFIDKIRKKAQNNANKSQQNSKNVFNPVNQQKNQQVHQSQAHLQKVKLQIKNSLNVNSKEESIQQQKEQNPDQNHKAIMENIHLNIKTGKLKYLPLQLLNTLIEEQKKQFLSKTQIYELLKSENNQSKIIGAQLILSWAKNLYPSQSRVFYVDGIPFHQKIMLQEFYPLLSGILQNVRKTKFYSCYIEMLVKSIQILTLLYKNLDTQLLQEQKDFFQVEFEKCQKSLKQFLNKNEAQQSNTQSRQQKQMLFQSLGILCQSLKDQLQLRTQNQKENAIQIVIQEKFQLLQKENQLDDLIEAILIEQTLHKQQFQKYHIQPTINTFLQTITIFWECKVKSIHENLIEADRFQSVLYLLVCKLNRKLRNFLFYKTIIKQIYSSLLKVLEQNYFKKVLQTLFSKHFFQSISSKSNKNIVSVKEHLLFKLLFIYRQLSSKSQQLAGFLQNSKSSWILSQTDACIIVYINFNHYVHVQDLNQDQIQMIQKMLKWVKESLNQQVETIKTNKKQNHMLNHQQVMASLFNLFLSSDQQVYSLIDQNILNEVLSKAIEFYELKRQKYLNQGTRVLLQGKSQILNENQIKVIIQNYNYNSFGNDIFTKIMFWIAVSINQQTQAMISEEVMMRYPMLFYYACEPTESTTQKQPNSQQKNLLFGQISKYFQQNYRKKQHYFTYDSNRPIKANLLKLLYLNLDFSAFNSELNKILKLNINLGETQQTTGFNLSKNKLNENNCFFKYLIQSFLKQKTYEQFF